MCILTINGYGSIAATGQDLELLVCQRVAAIGVELDETLLINRTRGN